MTYYPPLYDDRPTFRDATANSRSLIWVQNKQMAVHLFQRFRAHAERFQVIVIIDMHPEIIRHQIDVWHKNTLKETRGVLIVVMPMMKYALLHGWRCGCDNVIWIGDVPEVGTVEHREYMQAINRGNMQSLRLNYLESEL